MSDNQGIAWDYEEDYYQIYAYAGPFDQEGSEMSAIGIPAPETPENTADVQVIADALRRIASRLPQEKTAQ